MGNCLRLGNCRGGFEVLATCCGCRRWEQAYVVVNVSAVIVDVGSPFWCCMCVVLVDVGRCWWLWVLWEWGRRGCCPHRHTLQCVWVLVDVHR